MAALLVSIALAGERFVVSTFNVHCPAYRRTESGLLEAEDRAAWLARNRAILRLPFWGRSDFVAVQELWYGSDELTAMYADAPATRGARTARACVRTCKVSSIYV